jgi:phospholipase C
VLIPRDQDLEKYALSSSQQALHSFADFLHEEVDKVMGAAVSGTAAASKTWAWLTTALHWFGRAASQTGKWLSRGFDAQLKARSNRTEDAFARLAQARVERPQ